MIMYFTIFCWVTMLCALLTKWIEIDSKNTTLVLKKVIMKHSNCLTMNTYICNLHFIKFLCEMWLCNSNMSICQQVVGYHVYQIYTMCYTAFLWDSRVSTFSVDSYM